MLLQSSHFFSSCSSSALYTPPSNIPCPPYFVSMGCTCKFFGFSISYTILNHPLSILYLLFMLPYSTHLVPLFPPSPPLLTDNPSCDLYFCSSVPVLVVCLVCVCVFVLGSVVDSCEFVVILLFLVLIFFSDKSL